MEELKIPMGKPTPFSPSPFPDSRDRFSAPVPSDWLLFPWKLLFAYSKPPLSSSWTKTPLPSPKPTPPLPPPSAAAERSQVWEVLGRMMQPGRRWRHCGLSRGHGAGGGEPGLSTGEGGRGERWRVSR